MSDRDRDDLMQVIKNAPSGYDCVTDAVIEAGFRRTVPLEQIETAHLPELWWSPTHGIVRERHGVWAYLLDNSVTLRHDGLPNERPADAIRLGLVPEDGAE